MHSKQRLFNTARFEHEKEMRRKTLKQKKIWNPALFGVRNPLSWNFGIQYSESGIHRVESRVQDCHEFPYMGQTPKALFA